ncbi:DUF2147 domain-containing protein [Variovorax sp. LARHSF232]
MKPVFLLGATLAAASTIAAPLAMAQPAQMGRWITESGNLEVEIAPCADAPLLCGTVVRELAQRSMSAPGAPMDPADKRPVLGMKILTDLQPAGDEALRGQIYNRENGRHYSVNLAMDGPGQLLVRPYVVLPLFGKTQLWHRAAASSQEAN